MNEIKRLQTPKRARLVAIGGLFCAIVGSILGGLSFALLHVARMGPKDALAFIPSAILFAAVVAVPFGFVVGGVGSWWLVARLTSDASAKRVFYESAGIGALLGATFPLVMELLGWGPFGNLVSVLPISIGAGIICALALTSFMRSCLFRMLKYTN